MTIISVKKVLAVIISVCVVAATTAGCMNVAETNNSAQPADIKTKLPKLNMSKWKYNAKNDFYYQIGINYCEKPADEGFEKLAVFVPGAYMDAKKNGGTYTCKLNDKSKVKGYTSVTAPIVMPVNTPGYAADRAMTEDIFDTHKDIPELISKYTSQGFVFVHSGCRGANKCAPSAVTDLKSAIRYLRYCDDVIAGDSGSIFVFGMSGGGAQAAILAASGDNEMYDPYLKKIGAVQGASDSVAGCMSWCPVVDFVTANAEYEWMMGATREGISAEKKALSDDLAKAYADYVNKAEFTDKDGNMLTLAESENGIYQSGSYYDYIKGVIERSLNNYLSDNKLSGADAQKYINEMNAEKKWITYDQTTNSASITSVADFSKACKRAMGPFPAFDSTAVNNRLFSYDESKSCHFDKTLAKVLTKQNSDLAGQYNSDLKKKDKFGLITEQRVNMYSPIYYLLKTEYGYGKSNVAKHWRIRSGIEQSHTSLTTETNIALALEACDQVESVDFETVWAQNHTEAERKGNSVQNFISWVKSCVN